MKIVIGFSYPKKFKIGAFLIKKWSRTNFSHVYVEIESSYLRPENQIIYHAARGSVRLESVTHFKSRNDVVRIYEFDVSGSRKKAIMNFAISNSGEPYSFFQLIGLMFLRLAKLFGVKCHNPFGKNGYICTELVAELLDKHLGVVVRKEYDDINLNDIENLLGEYEERNRIKSKA